MTLTPEERERRARDTEKSAERREAQEGRSRWEKFLQKQNEQAKKYREKGWMERNASVHRAMNATLDFMEGKQPKGPINGEYDT